jgi:hypothetical protein
MTPAEGQAAAREEFSDPPKVPVQEQIALPHVTHSGWE